MSDLEEPKSGVSRRTVAKAMAWSVPAVALAVPAPAYAASGNPPTVAVGVACKLPGNSLSDCSEIAGIENLDPEKAYAIPLLVTNNTSKDIVLKPSITIETTSGTLTFTVVAVNPPYGTVIAPGESVKVIVYANGSSSANTEVTLTLTVPWGHDLNDTDHTPIVIPGIVIDDFPPCSSRTPFPVGAPTCDPPFYQE